MVSKIMTAEEAKRTYGNGYVRASSIPGDLALKNSDGRLVSIDPHQNVYMRGKGRFGIYEDLVDSHRKSGGFDPSTFIGKVGTGDHRHESDRHESERVPAERAQAKARKARMGTHGKGKSKRVPDRSIYD